MPYVVSRLANDQTYTEWNKPETANKNVARPATPAMKVLVKGGAGVMGLLHTPNGIATKITDAQAEMLLQNKMFQSHAKRGLVKVLAREPDAESVARDLAEDAGEVVNGERVSGGSAQLSISRGDFKVGGRAGGVAPDNVEKII